MTIPAEAQEAIRSFGISIEDYMLPVHGRVAQIQILDEHGSLRPEDERGSAPGHEYPIQTSSFLNDNQKS